MKTANIRKIILASCALVLALVYAMQLIFSGRTKQETLGIEKEITSIEISSPANGKLSLVQESSGWQVKDENSGASYVADSDVVQRLMDSISKIRLLGTAAGAGDEERYGLDENSFVKVQAFGNSKLLRTLYAGKDTTSGSQTYVKVDSRPQVYICAESLSGLFNRSLSELRSTLVYDMSNSDAVGITITLDNSIVSFEKKYEAPSVVQDAESESLNAPKAVWSLVNQMNLDDDYEFDSDKIAQWVNGLSFLRVSEWKEDSYQLPGNTQFFGKFTLRFDSAKASGGPDEVSIDAYRIPSDEDYAYVFKCSTEPYFFTLSESAKGKFVKTWEDFQK